MLLFHYYSASVAEGDECAAAVAVVVPCVRSDRVREQGPERGGRSAREIKV